MSLIKNNVLAGSAGSQDFLIDESLRFNASQSSYLSRTPASAGNRKTWTFSAWVKLAGRTSGADVIFGYATDSNNYELLQVLSSGKVRWISSVGGSVKGELQTTRLLRDPAAWYHIVWSKDVSNTSVKIYVNGVEETSFSYTQTIVNADGYINSTVNHTIGEVSGTSLTTAYLDGYLTEINFIDGQALDPTDFGETDSVTGVWKPKKYVGTYGTNGFYLPMKLDNTTEGFNTVTFKGNYPSSQKVTGVGFSPDLVWFKSRSVVSSHNLVDSVRGSFRLRSNTTDAESAATVTFDTDGFTVGSQSESNDGDMVAWCWDAGSSTVSNTDGSITSSVRANPTYGFSIVSYTGNSTSGATVGHGLGVAPSMVIVKARGTPNGAARSWFVYHSALGGTKFIYLDLTSAAVTGSTVWNNTNPSSTVFTLGNENSVNMTAYDYVAYCFAEISGYSKFGSYTGTGASGNTVTTGFKPAFVMIKRTDVAGGWYMWDTTRDAVNPMSHELAAHSAGAEQAFFGGAASIKSNATGFELVTTDTNLNASGSTYIYMAFADTREYAFWLDDSGNNNDWQPNGGITTQSSVTDVPTLTSETQGNYATLNPLQQSATGNSAANLKHTTTGTSSATATISVNSGKWYWEVTITNLTGIMSVGAITETYQAADNSWSLGDVVSYRSNGDKYGGGSGATAYGASYTTGDVIGIALDMNSGTIVFYKNNSSQGTAFSTWIGGKTLRALVGGNTTAGVFDINFGQRPFAYTPPTGFKALNTYNLPDSTVADGSDYFNTVLYTGNGSSNHSITGVGFQPDFTWLKGRSTTGVHGLWDAVRGATKYLVSNNTDAQVTDTTNGLQTFQSDGFTLGSVGTWNTSSASYVAWNWKANGSGVSNTDGSITSTVSANTTAGFSIVAYTGTGANATVGHGLGLVPSMVITKNRDSVTDWMVYHSGNTASPETQRLVLNGNYSTATSSVSWNNTAPTSSVFSVGSYIGTNGSTANMVAYCFAEVAGFSKIGSYTGNGSADGPFVYTGFRPAWVMFKRSDSTSDWHLYDTARSTYNVIAAGLYADLSNAENSGQPFDILSNGFKLRVAGGELNTSSATIIYLAFAENPAKYALAR